MTIFSADPTNFSSQLAKLGAGDTLMLADGNYGALSISKRDFGAGATIVGGTFSSVYMGDVDGLTLQDSVVNFAPTLTSTNNSQAIRIWSSSHIVIDNATVTGGLAINGVDPSATSLDATGNVLGYPAGKGINIDSSSSYVTISNSDISMFHKGILVGGSNITISNNEIHDLRTTPISGTVNSNLVISGNHTYNSTPWSFGGAGDHGDRIHIWTDKTAITGLVISDNLLEQGTGDAMLGIYLDDNGKGLGFTDALISGNTVIDGTGQGVLLENVTGTVTENQLIWSGTGTAYNNTPRFQISDGTHDVVFRDNSGNVSVAAGSHDLQFYSQNGVFTYASGLSAADRISITQDNTIVTAFRSATLADGLDNLVFAGTGDFSGTGNALDNNITGGSGNDILTGAGGADVLEGMTGNDTYVIDNASQKIVDTGGSDKVMSSVSWTLQYGLENLTYTGTQGAVLNGNSSNNIIIGGDGNDVINAGMGTDTMQGGLGDDTYYVDNMTQVIIDIGGIDSIITGRTFVLGSTIENLTLTGNVSTSGTGNALDNVIRGTTGANILDGKAGADTLYGGGGNDTYVVDNLGDRAIEVEDGVDGGGIDLVKVSCSAFTMDEGIENLTFTAYSTFVGTGNNLGNVMNGGGWNDTLYGMAGNDSLYGSSGTDTLIGGADADRLSGGTGNDTFVFEKGDADGDWIVDFTGNGASAGDTIKLVGWGAGTTMTHGLGTNEWLITDGLDGHIDSVTIAGTVHATDILFG